jgi:hypothetical protein
MSPAVPPIGVYVSGNRDDDWDGHERDDRDNDLDAAASRLASRR